jgi:hypothetical protein
MRINLVTPFAEKDAVKALGARWDAARKVWYIVDAADLTPFMRWIPDMAAASDQFGVSATQTSPAKVPASSSPGVITKPAKEVTHCGCEVLPWEDCKHSSSGAAS